MTTHKRITFLASEELQRKIARLKISLSTDQDTQVVRDAINRLYEKLIPAYVEKTTTPKATKQDKDLTEGMDLFNQLYGATIDDNNTVTYPMFQIAGQTIEVYEQKDHVTFLTQNTINLQFVPSRLQVEQFAKDQGKTLEDYPRK